MKKRIWAGQSRECVLCFLEKTCFLRIGFEIILGRVGVVAITLALHARGRGFNPRIRYFSFSFLEQTIQSV